MFMKTAFLKKRGIIKYCPGLGFRILDEACLPYPIFCFTKIIHKIHGEVVTKVLQYWKVRQNSSPVGSKWREFYVDVEFRFSTN